MPHRPVLAILRIDEDADAYRDRVAAARMTAANLRWRPRVPRRREDVALSHAYPASAPMRRVAIAMWPLSPLTVSAVISVGLGWLAAFGHINVAALLVIMMGFLVLALRAPALLAALLLLAVMNGVPVVNLAGRLPGGLPIRDAAVFALIVLLYAYRGRSRSVQGVRLERAATIWSTCFIAWWTFTVARSVLLDSIPLLQAVLYGRDFLYFAILLPLALRVRFPMRSFRPAGGLLLLAAILYAIGESLQSLTGIAMPWLAHPTLLAENEGLTRLYSPMTNVVITCLIFLGALLLSPAVRGRRWGAGSLALILMLGAVFQLFRANYAAMAVAFVVGLTIYAVRYSSVTAVLVRSAVVVMIMVVLGIASATEIKEGQNTSQATDNPITMRVEEGVSDTLHSQGSVGYREMLDEKLLQVLGMHWPVGLGFLHPAAHYVAGLPFGTIRNTDTGVLNVLMTMGIVGVILIYAPLAYGFRELLRASKIDSPRPRGSSGTLVYGGAAWIAWAVAGSLTLVLLFSIDGLVLTALVLAFLGQAITRESVLPNY